MKAFKPVSNGLLRYTKLQLSPVCPAASKSSPYLHPKNYNRPQQRSFVPNLFNSQPQTLTAKRTLPYSSTKIYNIISDVASYSHFLPYCQSSLVTKYSSPTAGDGKSYPEEATLTIGFNDSISESFTSRIYCVPHRIIEAVTGSTLTTLPSAEIAHHSPRPSAEDDPSRQNAVMTHLLTRWTLRPYPYERSKTSAMMPGTTRGDHEGTGQLLGQEQTEVNLAIEFQFVNPLYAALSAAAAPGIAEKMIEAFENRLKAVVNGPGGNDKPRSEAVLGKEL